MKLLFKQRIFSWFDSYDIYDENNQIIDQAYVYVFNMDNRRNVSALENDIESHDYVKYIQEIKRNEKTYSIDE